METSILRSETMLQYASLLSNERRIPSETVKYTKTILDFLPLSIPAMP